MPPVLFFARLPPPPEPMRAFLLALVCSRILCRDAP